ncbi:phage tail protein [Parasulfitobacter algicola]|uniref:Uncharacterized protein n=1 Tax=Parasulfitobacter algicola TaxID=2614809 RepID=A0ABX2IYW5_9RHOB|nr:phage tail protein [Sulfitobacter algicola]NSX55753.1 hypothetical protein [Sulfitobacter algicola]
MNAEQIANLLPEFWQEDATDGSPQQALFHVMSDMLTPAEDQIDAIDITLNPLKCPAHMLPFLTRMLGLDPLLPFVMARENQIDQAALRLLLQDTPHLLDQRGTQGAVIRALTIALGPGFEIDEIAALAGGFHVIVKCPKHTQNSAALIDAIIWLLKPAHVTHDIEWKGTDAQSNDP